MKGKRTWKSVICLICCMVMLQQAAGAAVIGNVEETEKTIVISGTIENGAGRAVAINILKPGTDLSQAVDEEGSLAAYSIYTKTVVADAQGRYQFTVKKPDYGEYEVVVSAGEDLRETRTIYLISQEQMQSRIETFNQTPAEQMAERIEADTGLFGLQFEPYDTLLEQGNNLQQLYQKLADTTFTSAEQIRRTFRQETLAAAVYNADEQELLEQMLQLYEDDWFYDVEQNYLTYWNSEEFSERGGKKETVKQWFANKQKAVDFQAARQELIQAIAVSALTTSTGFTQGDQALLVFAPVYGIDTSVYQGLAEKKELVYKELMEKDISSAGKIKTAFESAIQSVTSAPGGNTGGIGGGGGGTGGGGGGGSAVRPGGGISSGTNIDIYQNPVDEPEQQAFLDLGEVSWAEKEITELANRGILQGRADGQFEPNAAVTREEFVKMLVVAFQLADADAVASFEDVPENNWCYSYVASAVKAGIVQGVSQSRFGAGENISRQDMAVMAARTLQTVGVTLPEGTITFADTAEIAPYAIEAVSLLVQADVIHGTDGNQFQPQGIATRAEAAKIIYGLLAAAGR